VVRSDVTRKRLFAHEMEQPLPAQAYTREATARTYAQMVADARAGLAAGFTVIADAVHADPAERTALQAAAREAGVRFAGLWLEAPLEVRMRRVGGRDSDASDATVDYLKRHPALEAGEPTWTRIDAAGAPESVAGEVLRHLREANFE
jgi:hypothetical protein